MTSRSDEAQALASAIEVGAIPIAEVHEWADRLILADDSPSDLLLDISLCKSVPDAISHLHSFDESTSPASAALVFGHLLRGIKSGRITHAIAAGTVERMARGGCIPTPEAESHMYSFRDEMELIEQGVYGSTEEIQSELETFLDKFSRT